MQDEMGQDLSAGLYAVHRGACSVLHTRTEAVCCHAARCPIVLDASRCTQQISVLKESSEMS